MGNSLVIVESPAKAKTIRKFLGRKYVVKASVGHVIDLPKSQFGVDIEDNFKPKYITIRGKGPVLQELKKQCKKSDKIYLAADPDREGEAICWHLAEYLDLDQDKCRVEFNEITKSAVKSAFKNPREIDMSRVYAQQARRVLDRIVGYKLSPLLWQKVKKGLSAGRVQTVALRIICEREKEIEAFKPEEYWSIEAQLTPGKKKDVFEAELVRHKSKKIKIENKEMADKILSELKNSDFQVKEITRRERKRNPLPPFITSSMQQESWSKIGFSSRKTMAVAQQLYEGLEIGSSGSVGLISYIRTDSLRVSNEAQGLAKTYIKENFGKEYVPKYKPKYKTKEGAQDAHEAIRPTDVLRTPESIKKNLTSDQYKLYDIIWKRFIASQMAPAIVDTTSVHITAGDYMFRASGSIIKFPGFLKVYSENGDYSKIQKEAILPSMSKEEVLKLIKITPEQHFTKAPPRFTEAMLVKTLEEKGIGRPSTYAAIIDTILRRGYVVYEEKKLKPTELGQVVTELLINHFPNIFDIDFTASMESRLDKIEEGQEDWINVLETFYPSFEDALKKAEANMKEIQVKDEESDVICDKCGKNMVIKHGRYGKFLACPGFPDCRNTKPFMEEIGVKCPDCGGEIVKRRTRKGRIFYGCKNYPECEFISWNQPVKKSCPECGSFLVEVNRKKGKLHKCAKKDCAYDEVAT